MSRPPSTPRTHPGRNARRRPVGPILALAGLLAVGGIGSLHIAHADEAALAILKKTEALRQPGSSIQQMTMVVTDRKGFFGRNFSASPMANPYAYPSFLLPNTPQ